MTKRVYHFVRLPASVEFIRDLYCAFASVGAHYVTDDMQAVTCSCCLARYGITAAGPRMVDADGREVASGMKGAV